MLLRLHDYLLRKKISLTKKAALGLVCLVYPASYAFWCYKSNELWVIYNLKVIQLQFSHNTMLVADQKPISSACLSLLKFLFS